MLLLELLAALMVASVLSGLFVVANRKRSLRKGLFWLFLVLFLATWAGGVWMKPFGPTLWGIHWLSFLFVGLVVALILAVAQARPNPHSRQETIEMLERIRQEREMEQVAWLTLTIFFWVLLFTLLIAIVVRYVK
jgi:hypothetical protein